MKFRIPELNNWEPTPWSSFDSIVRQVQSVRQKNAWMAQQKGWSLDLNVIADEVDIYNAKLCEDHGWIQYLALPVGANAPPKPKALSEQEQSAISAAAGRAKRIWSGVKTLNEWLDSNDPGVSSEQSAKRAAVCAGCSKNESGGLEAWFTGPASEVIKNQIEKASSRNLSTPFDDKLQVCTVCHCPLKLAVHVPLSIKLAHLSSEVEAELRRVQPPCWVCQEKDNQ